MKIQKKIGGVGGVGGGVGVGLGSKDVYEELKFL